MLLLNSNENILFWSVIIGIPVGFLMIASMIMILKGFKNPKALFFMGMFIFYGLMILLEVNRVILLSNVIKTLIIPTVISILVIGTIAALIRKKDSLYLSVVGLVLGVIGFYISEVQNIDTSLVLAPFAVTSWYVVLVSFLVTIKVVRGLDLHKIHTN